MIRDKAAWEAWERNYRRSKSADFFHNLRVFEGLYEEACDFGLFPLKEPLGGLDIKIRLAKAVNVSTIAGSDRSGT
jgi:hypothetical protein